MNQANRKRKVLFICTHNSARSQMAEALLRDMHNDYYEAYSAGTEPSHVNPYAIQVMAEIGINISTHHSKSVDEFNDTIFDSVVTVCDHAKGTCPFFQGGVQYIHKSFEDPAEFNGTDDEILTVFKRVRDEEKEWIEKTFGQKKS